MKRVLAVGATALLIALVPSAAVSAGSPAPEGKSTDPLNRAMQFRATSGLRADPAFVQSSLDTPTDFPIATYGVPLTAAESAEIDRRLAVQIAVDPVVEWAATLQNFGGAYMDQADRGTPVFQIVGDTAAFSQALADRLPAGVTARIESVANTRRSLVATKERIWADRASLRAAGIDVESASLDIRNNAVLVEIGAGQSTDASRTVAADLSGYGTVATTPNAPAEHDACTSRSTCVPMKGGLKIVVTGHSASWCTSGFNVRMTGTTNMRVLTAGHCLSLSPTGVKGAWSVNGSKFGNGTFSTWANGANADAGLISQAAITGADNLLYGSGTSDIRTVGGWVVTASQNVGDSVCRSGAASGWLCGHVSLEDRTKDVDGKSIDHQWVVDFDAIPGDSGAPYITTSSGVTLAWGTHSDSTSANPPGGSAWYSPFPYIQSVVKASGNEISLCTEQYCGL
jgi:hypothetical protein